MRIEFRAMEESRNLLRESKGFYSGRDQIFPAGEATGKAAITIAGDSHSPL